MGQTAIDAMTADEFFAWQEIQDDLYELVDGFPLKMMTGAENRHDQITVNLIVAIDPQLRGKSCRPTTQDTAIQISKTQVRRPDMAINCGPIRDKTYIASDPRVVFEVLSPSTRLFDHSKKLEEYKSVASLAHIVLIDPDRPEVLAFARQADGGWASRAVKGLAAEIAFVELECVLTLAEIYRDLTFRPGPRLVMVE